MKKQILRGLVAIFVAVTAIGSARAQMPQQIPPLPADTAVVAGVLENGLSYFIRHNETPKGQADFYIAQKVGSALEEENQRGLAHFLEHMCFNGTDNFPGKGIINWCEANGIKFGYNLNAYTSIDETVYNISNVPVARAGVQDTCLLILHDWASALTLDPKEIDAERGVIHEEWRRSMSGQMRVLEQLLPVIYPDNVYGKRLPIGIMEVVDNFPPQTLVDYYHKWYRPDNQAIIVVGDIDPAYIQKKIVEIFSPIKMPENPAERVYFEVEDTPGTIYAIGKDKEITSPSVDMMFKTDALWLPREYRNTQMYYPADYISKMIDIMLNNRLSEIANNPETEFASASVNVGSYFISDTKGALDLSVSPKDTDAVPAFTQAYRELLRAVRGGFTVGEYERAKAEFLSKIDKLYQSRNNRENDSYSREYARLFTQNLPAPGIDFEKQMYEQLAQGVPVDAINQVLPQMITEDNRVLLGLFPDNENYPVPTGQDFAAAIEKVDAETLEPYKDTMREDPLIPSLPAPGKIARTAENKEWGATEYTLSNGVKVIVKKTDFKTNEIVFDIIAKGKGISTLSNDIASSVKYLPVASGTALGLYDYNTTDLQKYMQGKQAEISFSAGGYTREFEGNTTAKDLPTAMEMIYAYFTGFNIKADDFASKQAAHIASLANQESNPMFTFQKLITGKLFTSPMRQVLTVDDVKNADLATINSIVKDMTANAADYTFIFVGDIDTATFVPLMEQYIATLPADPKKATTEYVKNPAFELPSKAPQASETTKMETPQTWALICVYGKMPYTTKNKLLAEAAEQVLSKRLLNKIREEMGATYSIGASVALQRTSEQNTMLEIAFPMKPEMKNDVLQAIHDIIFASQSDISDEEIKPATEFMQKDIAESLEKNQTWASAIAATSMNGVNTFLSTEKTIPEVTDAEVEAFMKKFLSQGNYSVLILDPEQ